AAAREALVAGVAVGVAGTEQILDVLGDERLLGVGARVGGGHRAPRRAERRDASLDQFPADHRERRATGIAVALAGAAGLVVTEQQVVGHRRARRRRQRRAR